MGLGFHKGYEEVYRGVGFRIGCVLGEEAGGGQVSELGVQSGVWGAGV